MPYITPKQRKELAVGVMAATAGELNYAITVLVDRFLDIKGGLSYAAINEVIGVLECAKLELYRRLAAPYEDAKCRENGDVYDA
ncbi:MAG: hypothetical protein WC683_07095 [bacterium]